jgi:hypothetical protein
MTAVAARRRLVGTAGAALLVLVLGAGPVAANPCLDAIAGAAARHGVPDGLLRAVGVVESGRPDADGRLAPWPWTLNVAGNGRQYADPLAAWDDLEAALAGGERSVDVGCMQINLAAHPEAFAGPGDALDPVANVDYAARFLSRLRDETGSWEQAVAYYHSRTPRLAAAYRQKVAAAGRGGLPADVSRPVVLGGDFRPSPIATGGGAFDAAAVLRHMRETRRITEIVRQARR